MALPREHQPSSPDYGLYKQRILRLWPWLLVIAIVGLPFFIAGLRLLLLQTLPETFSIWREMANPWNWAIAIFVAIVPGLLWGLMALEAYAAQRWRLRGSAVVFSLVAVLGVNALLQQPKVQQWFLFGLSLRDPVRYQDNATLVYQTTIVRWKRAQLHDNVASLHRPIIFFGSSQISAAVNPQKLQELNPTLHPKRMYLPGLKPILYSILADDIIAKRPRLIVCFLSEFDFLLSHDIPANRIRHFATFNNQSDLWQALNLSQRWAARYDLVDIGLATLLPVWRDRDLLASLVRHFWWHTPPYAIASASAARTARTLAKVLETPALFKQLARTFQSSQLFLQPYLQYFANFAQQAQQENIPLIVFEGQVHPEMLKAYDPQRVMRTKIRQALQAMALKYNYTYIPTSAMPRFDGADFVDPIHFNQQGSTRFTHYLSTVLAEQLADY